MMRQLAGVVLVLVVYGFGSAPGWAKNVDLSTVPKRDTVQLTIYNSEDLTLVRETRVVSFKKGLNSLQFSWANTLIDPTSVELRFPSHGDRMTVLDTTFPHDKPQMLYWNVDSGIDGEVAVEITYFTSGITWSADYLMVAGVEEKHLRIEGFVRVFNNSGEDYPDAQVRVVVGSLNLVEKIAQLANIPVRAVGRMDAKRKNELRYRAAKGALMAQDAMAESQPKEIIKEGLSEYFIYTIEGKETIPEGWSKRLRSFDGANVPFEIRYRYRPQQFGEQLARFYLLRNDEASGLGSTPLPNGKVTVFRDNGRDGLSYLATRELKYVPIGDRIEVNLGADQRVLFELQKLKSVRENIWLKLSKSQTYQRVGDSRRVSDRQGKVVGWDERVVYARRIRNYSNKPITVEIRRHFPGDVEFRSALDAKRHDFRTVEFSTSLAVGKTRSLLYEVLTRKGRNGRQNEVKIARARVQRPRY